MNEAEQSPLEEFLTSANIDVSTPEGTTETPAVEHPAETEPTPEAPETEQPESAQVEAEPEAEAEQGDKVLNPQKKKFSNRSYKKLQYENRMLQRQMQELSERMNALQTPEEKEIPQPRRSDFNSDEDYIEAATMYQYAKARTVELKAEAEAREQNEAVEAFKSAWTEKLKRCFPDEASQEEFRDAYEAANGTSIVDMVGVDLGGYIYQQDTGPLIQKYLWEHPTVVERLQHSHQIDQVDIIRKIQDFVAPAPQKPKSPSRPQPTPFGSAKTGNGSASASTEMSAEDVFRTLAFS